MYSELYGMGQWTTLDTWAILTRKYEEQSMSDVLPEGEDLRRAVKWVSTNIQEGTDRPVSRLVEEAIFKFDLSPKDSEFLITFFAKHGK